MDVGRPSGSCDKLRDEAYSEDMITLDVKKRDTNAGAITLSALRAEGGIPAVVYGASNDSTPITVNAKIFSKVLQDSGEATVVSLKGLAEDIPVLIHDVDLDPITSYPRHIDFYAITKGEKVQVAISLDFVGESDAAEAGANIVKVLHEIEVKADPMNLPQTIEVNLALLEKLNDQIKAKDLHLPTGVELAVDIEDVIALAKEVVEEKEDVVEADIDSIEVEKTGKEEKAPDDDGGSEGEQKS